MPLETLHHLHPYSLPPALPPPFLTLLSLLLHHSLHIILHLLIIFFPLLFLLLFRLFSSLLPFPSLPPPSSCLQESTASICCCCSSRRRLDFSRQSTPSEVNYAGGDASLVRVSDGGGATQQLITHWPAVVCHRQVVHLRSNACGFALFLFLVSYLQSDFKLKFDNSKTIWQEC